MAEKIIVDSTGDLSEWFMNANMPFTAIAQMLIELDGKGLVPCTMRKAIHRHAENSIQTLPLSIASTAISMAAATSGFGMDKGDIAHAAYGMQSLAELMHGWTELVECFGSEREVYHG